MSRADRAMLITLLLGITVCLGNAWMEQQIRSPAVVASIIGSVIGFACASTLTAVAIHHSQKTGALRNDR